MTSAATTGDSREDSTPAHSAVDMSWCSPYTFPPTAAARDRGSPFVEPVIRVWATTIAGWRAAWFPSDSGGARSAALPPSCRRPECC